MRYIVAAPNGIKRGSDGETWRCGQYIGPSGFPVKLWRALLDEGAVKPVEDNVPTVVTKPPDAVTEPQQGAIYATPTAVARAAENDVDLAEVTGSGRGGRITAADVDLVLHEREGGA